jgi:hypothetical protein
MAQENTPPPMYDEEGNVNEYWFYHCTSCGLPTAECQNNWLKDQIRAGVPIDRLEHIVEHRELVRALRELIASGEY